MSSLDRVRWWHVYPLGFCGAPVREPDTARHPEDRPRLERLSRWLDYAVDLGVSGLLLGPVFTSSSHGYDSLDQFRIDPRLGDDAAFDALLRACQARGLPVVLDGVFSHVGADHPDLVRALQDGPDSPTAALFDIDWHAPDGPAPRVFEGHGGLARLNHASPAAIDYAVSVMTHWLRRGIDGWRLDAAYAVDPAFWAQVLPRVRAEYPDAWFLGEVIHGDYAAFVAESGVDTVTQYELWKAIWSSLLDRNLFELDWALTRHNGFLETFTPNTFVGNHDVTRITSTLGEERAIAALAIVMTVGGTPSIYAGDEQGFLGVKEQRVGGDDAVRPAFPDHPEELAPWGREIYRAHQQLLDLRARHPWLVTAGSTAVRLENTRYNYRATSRDGREHLEVAIDLENTPTVQIWDASGALVWAHPG